MKVSEFKNKLNDLIREGCTEISAYHIGDDVDKKAIIFAGCQLSGSIDQYLKLSEEEPNGVVLADYRDLSSVSFRVAEERNGYEFDVCQIKKDGNAAMICLQ